MAGDATWVGGNKANDGDSYHVPTSPQMNEGQYVSAQLPGYQPYQVTFLIQPRVYETFDLPVSQQDF